MDYCNYNATNTNTNTYTDYSLDCIGFVTTDYEAITEVEETPLDDSEEELEMELMRLVEQEQEQ